MQTFLPDELTAGMVLMLESIPHRVEESYVSGSAKTRHKTHFKIRNLTSGHVSEHTFPDNGRIPVADVEHRNIQLSYKNGDEFVFTDSRTFDEFTLPASLLGERQWFLAGDQEYKAVLIDNKLVDIILPDHVVLKVADTAAPQRKGQSSSFKTARMEGGLEVMVPLFIGNGDLIEVDTSTRRYIGKES